MAEFPQPDLASQSTTQQASVGASAATAVPWRERTDTSGFTRQDWKKLKHEPQRWRQWPNIFAAQSTPAWKSTEEEAAAQVSAAMVGGGPDLQKGDLFAGLEDSYEEDKELLETYDNWNREQNKRDQLMYQDMLDTAATWGPSEKDQDTKVNKAQEARQKRVAKMRKKRQQSKLKF